MEGRNCFRSLWVQQAFYSGGGVSSLRVVQQTPQQTADSSDQECVSAVATMDVLVTPYENTIQLVDPSSGAVLASYAASLDDDIVLHIDSIRSEGIANAEHPDQSVPAGSFIAFTTRSFQVYLVEVVVSSHADRSATNDVSGTALTVRLIRQWTAAQTAIALVRFSESAQLLFCCSTDGQVKAWNAFHYHLTHNMKTPHGVVTALAFSEDATMAVVGNFEGWVTVLDLTAKRVMASHRVHTSAVEALRISSGVVTSVGRDRRIGMAPVTDVAQQRPTVIKEHVSCAMFEVATDWLHVGSPNGALSSYRVNTSDEVKVMSRSVVASGAKSDDVDEEYSIRGIVLSTPRTATLTRLPVIDASAEPTTVFVATSGFHIVQYHRAAKVWSTQRTLVGFLDQVLDVKLVPRTAAAVGASNSSGKKFNGRMTSRTAERVVVTNSKEVLQFRGHTSVVSQVYRGHTDIVVACSLSSDGTMLATGSKDRTVRVWSVSDGHCLHSSEPTDSEISVVSFNCKITDTYVVLLSACAAGHLTTWDVLVARNRQSTLLQSKFTIADAHQGPILSMAVSPNDAVVATGGKDKLVIIWNLQGKQLFKDAALKGHKRAVTAVAFSPVDRVLASSSNDGSVRLWSLTTGSCLKALQADKVAVLQLAFFNKGTQLVTGNAEGLLRFWAISTAEAVCTLDVHSDKIWGLAVLDEDEVDDETNEDDDASRPSRAPSSTLKIVSGAANGSIVVSEDFTAEEAQRLCEERKAVVYNEQELTNAMRKGLFADAFRLALDLNHPRHLRQVLVRWVSTNSDECLDELRLTLLPSLSPQNMKKLLHFAREWGTNSRHGVASSIVVHAFLRAFRFDEIVSMDDSIRILLESLHAYTARHAARIGASLEKLHYLDFLVRGGGTQQAAAAVAEAGEESNSASRRKRLRECV